MGWLLDLLPGLAIDDTSRRQGRGTQRTRRTVRLTPGPGRPRGRQRQGPGLGWRIGAALIRRFGGQPHCPGCGRVVERATDRVCARCRMPLTPLLTGQRGPDKACPACGRLLQPSDKVCPGCDVHARVQRQKAQTAKQIDPQRRAWLAAQTRAVKPTLAEWDGTAPAPTPAENYGLWDVLNAPPPRPFPRPVARTSRQKKAVAVQAHTREDGTAVPAHTRSKPGKGGAA